MSGSAIDACLPPTRGANEVWSGSPTCFSSLVPIAGLGSRGDPHLLPKQSKQAGGPHFCIPGMAVRRDPAPGYTFTLCQAALHAKFGPPAPRWRLSIPEPAGRGRCGHRRAQNNPKRAWPALWSHPNGFRHIALRGHEGQQTRPFGARVIPWVSIFFPFMVHSPDEKLVSGTNLGPAGQPGHRVKTTNHQKLFLHNRFYVTFFCGGRASKERGGGPH